MPELSLVIAQISENELIRFLSKIDKSDEIDACWNWIGGKFNNGRGLITFGRSSFLAHRVTWGLVYGEIPDNLCVCHRCDNPLCCNPRHLFLGEQADNVRDMVKKNRQKTVHGAENGNAKLTREQVDQLRSQYAQGGISQIDLGKRYGISQSQVSAIVRHECHVS